MLQLVQTFQSAGWRSRWWYVLIAMLYILGGVVIIIDPVLASVTLTLLLGAMILAAGVMRLMVAWQHRGEAGNGLFWLTGFLALLLGAVIIAHWPYSGFVVIGTSLLTAFLLWRISRNLMANPAPAP